MTDKPTTDAEIVAALHRIRLDTERMNGPDLIALAVKHCQSQAILARMSGLTPNTITAVKQGKGPSLSTRSAILWAIALSMGI